MRRHARAILPVVSLFLCLLFAVGWVRSYRILDLVYWLSSEKMISLESRRGEVSVAITWQRAEMMMPEFDAPEVGYERGHPGKPGAKDRALGSLPGVRHHFHAFGFRFYVSAGVKTGERSVVPPWLDVAVPHWLLVMLFAIAPARWVASLRRERRVLHRSRAGMCIACGYDLRASPTLCPECGAARKIAHA